MDRENAIERLINHYQQQLDDLTAEAQLLRAQLAECEHHFQDFVNLSDPIWHKRRAREQIITEAVKAQEPER